MFVCHFVSTSSQGSSWVQHMSILLFIITGAFSTNEKVWTLSDFTRVLSRQIKWTVKHAFERRCFLLLQFKDFFLPGSTIRIRNISKWCFSQFKFWFAYERFLPFSRIWTSWSSHHSITLRSFQLWKIRLFLHLFTLKSQLFSFAANCMALMSMTSAKSPDNEQIKQTLTCAFDSLKLLHEITVLIFVLHSFSFFGVKTYFLPMFKAFYVMFIIFFLFWWLLRAYFKHTFA